MSVNESRIVVTSKMVPGPLRKSKMNPVSGIGFYRNYIYSYHPGYVFVFLSEYLTTIPLRVES